MHWILAVTIMTTSHSSLMGSFNSQAECEKAKEAFFAMADPKQLHSASCIREDSPALKLFTN